MAFCDWCSKDMLQVDTCDGNILVEFPDKVLPAIPFRDEFDQPDARCHDCNVRHGGFHHPGCDQEVCPNCMGQLISCGCLESGE